MGYRLTGSSDLFQLSGRRPYAQHQLRHRHDGFTLHDLVTYNHKHNEANGEHNRDGADDNQSWNCGVEGETDDPEIIALRERQKRNLLATLFCLQGVPMLLAGDEMGRTQRGNNNAYCQDNELSWVDWNLDERRQALLEFTARLIQLRARSSRCCSGAASSAASTSGTRELKDLAWFRPDGKRDDQGGLGEALRPVARVPAGRRRHRHPRRAREQGGRATRCWS